MDVLVNVITNTVSRVWNLLAGKKRRIAIIALLISKLFPQHTVTHQVAEIIKNCGDNIFYLFGTTDLMGVGITKIKEQLPLKDTTK